VIRFSASLVVVGLGLLVAGGITSKLVLIYVSIAICAVALLFLIIGAIVNRAELLGHEPDGIASGQTETGGYAGEQSKEPEPAASTVGVGAPAGASRAYARENADSPGYGTTATPPDRPREASSPRGAQPASHDFPGYERFAGDAERRRSGEPPKRPARPSSEPSRPSSEPSRPFVEPEPTRMDLTAADVREAGRKDRDRTDSNRAERDRADQNRPERQPVDPAFTDPNPTRMDLTAADIREAGRQERTRPSQDRPERDRPERDRSGPGRPERDRPDEQPFTDPAPTRMDLGPALREREKQEREKQEREQRDRSGAGGTSAPAPTQPATGRPDKLLVGRPDGKTPPDRPTVPADATARSGTDPSPDQPAGNDAGDTRGPAERAAVGTSPARPADDETTSDPAASKGASERPAEVAATREQPTLTPATREQPTLTPAAPDRDQPADDGKDSPADSGSAGRKVSALSGQDVVTVVPGVPRYHRSDCILIRFMGDSDLQRMSVERAQEAGCTPCRACQPDGEEEE
jgi:hypothetical protein